MRVLAFCISLLILGLIVNAQTIELMPHEDGLFGDVQFLKPLSASYTWTVFSRTRIDSDLENDNNILSALYLSYTTKSGLGGTVLGALSNASSNSGVGIHYLLNSPNVSLFALPYITIKEDVDVNWFSILRFRPEISEKWKVYSSLELFAVYNDGHQFSVQRIRGGMEVNSNQFGLAINLSQIGSFRNTVDTGLFFRKEF